MKLRCSCGIWSGSGICLAERGDAARFEGTLRGRGGQQNNRAEQNRAALGDERTGPENPEADLGVF